MSPRKIKLALLSFFSIFFVLIIVQTILNAESARLPTFAYIDSLLLLAAVGCFVCAIGLAVPDIFGFRMEKPVAAFFIAFVLLMLSRTYVNAYGTFPDMPKFTMEIPKISMKLPTPSLALPASGSGTPKATTTAASDQLWLHEVQPQPGIPVSLSIPSAHIQIPIEQVGITVSGEMESPKVPEQAGWYSLGPRPGMKGQAIILGHSGWVRGRAVAFDNLDLVKKGDTIMVTDDLGKVHTYTADSMHTYSYDKPLTDMMAGAHGDGLALITCAGDWDKAKKTYKQRLVVLAVEK